MKPRTVVIAVAAALAAAAVAVWLLRDDDRPGRAAKPSRVRPVPGADLRVRIDADPLHAIVGAPVALAAEVERGEGRRGALAYTWVAPRGALDRTTGSEVVWTAPGKPGRYAVGVVVEDGDGRARGEVTIEVRLPSPDEVAELDELMKRLAARREAEVADLAALERRAEELRATGAIRESISDRLRAQAALEELAGVLVELGRVEEARAVWDELLAGMLPTDAKFRSYRASYGDVAFLLGDDEAALAAWADGGDYVQGMSKYYQAEVLERRGDLQGALDAYTQAQDGSKWFGDPVYRQALLLLEGGAGEGDVAALLVDASARLDRDRMLARFEEDPEMAPLRATLERTGRIDDLSAARPLEIEADTPVDP